MPSEDYEKNFIKGFIAQEIFAFMARSAGFRVIRYGYEVSAPEVAHRFRSSDSILPREVSDRIRRTPDFILLRENQANTKVLMVEVKFRYDIQSTRYPIQDIANEIHEQYPNAHICLAALKPEKTFYFDSVENIKNLPAGGLPTKLEQHEEWTSFIGSMNMSKYYDLLHNFIQFPENQS